MGFRERDPESIARMRRQLLDWYDRNRRDLPWRRSRDPYAIWVSEVMLQQTRVAVVIERFQAFLTRFPSLISLALAPEQEVLALWSGLGYYRRARMLHKAAQFVAEHHDGTLPLTAPELRMLPGIGSYTAAAIASIAHDEHVPVVDGNVERVLCRLQGWEAVGRAGAATLRRKIDGVAQSLLDPARPGDFNQALMELGATVCAPRNPRCLVCPLSPDCATRGEHKTRSRPRMLSKEIGCALVLRGKSDQMVNCEVLLEQRPDANTVMPGLWQLPVLHDPVVPDKHLRMTVRHAIMQVNYYVRVRNLTENEVDVLTSLDGRRMWVPLLEAGGMALTGLTRKILSRAHLLPTLPIAAIAPQTAGDVP
ncbi:MAG TPA: A/G-specific adenine glycosylase [Terracidiphilus sp.]|jgi:A/G-specific adenine glycosylase|nr:A/G-specific adenine glycosylase [Terracidiphilus sp.]